MQYKSSKGLFINFEGIDGAGKSSHLKTVREHFESFGREVVQTREPGGTPLGEKLRALILNEPMAGITEACLAFAARAEHLHQVILPALQRDAIVLSDRFTDSSFAYQGFGRGVPLDDLRRLEMVVQGMGSDVILQPHVTLWFDVVPATAAKRLQFARAPDKFESEAEAFFIKVSQGYTHRMSQDIERFYRINANGSIEQVESQVREALLWIDDRFGARASPRSHPVP